jgi:hypothetical protein
MFKKAKIILVLYWVCFLSLQMNAQDLKKMALSIDVIVAKKLRSLKQPFRKPIDDYTFARRIYINAIGRIPTLGELQEFIADKSSSKVKRSKLITKLLRSKGYNSHMYNYWADLLRVKYIGDKLHSPINFSESVKEAVRSNKPYNQFVREVVGAQGPLYKPGNGAVGFQARENMQLDRLANTVKTFLGVSIECSQCHDDPFGDMTQKEFYKLAAFTSKVNLRVDPPIDKEKKSYRKIRGELKKASFDQWIVYRESLRMKYAAVYGTGTGYMRLPHDYKYKDGKAFDVMQANVLFGAMPTMNYAHTKEQITKAKNNKHLGPPIGAKQGLAEWMTSTENPMFTKATVNRLWNWVMGTELVGPVANLELGDTGTHPELTAKLVSIMKAVKYDTKKFLSVLFHSRIYQSRALALQTKKPKYILDGPLVRRLSSEVLWDSLLSLKNGDPDKFIPTKFHHGGFTLYYEKTQKWTAEDFRKFSVESGYNRGQLSHNAHKEATKLNEPTGPVNESRASEADNVSQGKNRSYLQFSTLFGASERELIDGANQEPNIPQVLFLLNGSNEHLLIRGKSYINTKLQKVKVRQKRDLLWLAILGRKLYASERRLTDKVLKSKSGIKDIMWALLNSNEFRFSR